MIKWVNWPAPMGGLNAVDAGPNVPRTDCLELINMVASERGLRVRLGSREWVTGLTGATNNVVRTLIPLGGAAASGANDKLYAVTESGIWDITASTTSPTITVPFPSTVDKAGYGIVHAVSIDAGRYLLYTDEENGLYVYTAATDAWAKVAAGTTQEWAINTDYEIGNEVVANGNVYVCDTDGRSAGSGTGPSGTGTNIVDNTTRWDYVSAASTTVIGPSLSDQQAGLSADPADFAFVMAFKNRLWFVERDTSRAWYLPVGAVYGTVTSFDFGVAFKHGGELVGLWNWTYDAGNGPDDRLVALSGEGDVAVYEGNDPASASTFEIHGTWYVGGVPAGRRIATDSGGHIISLALLGAVPLNKLVQGVTGDELYATRKIAPYFASEAKRAQAMWGWSLVVHPTDNALIVLVPQNPDTATKQLVLSLNTGGWSRYEDLPMTCAAAWGGELYFGTADGRVMRNIGTADELKLADASAYTAITWKLLTGFEGEENGRQKRVGGIRPVLRAGSSVVAINSVARYDYDETVAPTPTLTLGAGPNDWGTGLWGTMVWSGPSPSNLLAGATGCGRAVAVAITGKTIASTTLVDIGVGFSQGGLL